MCRLDLTKFQKRDNMLRESSIAQDYWESELKVIKESEREEFGQRKTSESRTSE